MIYYAKNHHNKTIVRLTVGCWEELQTMFRFGILMPDGGKATTIGQVADRVWEKARNGYTTLNANQ